MSSPRIPLTEALAAGQGGAISSGVLYPLEMIKKILQSQSKMRSKRKGKSKSKKNSQSQSTSSSSNNGQQQQQQQQQQQYKEQIKGEKEEEEEEEETEEEDDEEIEEEEEEITFFTVTKKIYQERGYGGFFGGVEFAVIQSFLEKFIYFFAYTAYKSFYMKRLRRLLTDQDQKNNSSHSNNEIQTIPNLLIGYLSELTHLPLTVPLEVIITRFITSNGKVKSLREAIQQIHSENGLMGFYKGIEAYFVTGFRSAIQYTIFEQLRNSVLQTMNASRRARSQNNGGSFTPVSSLTSQQAFLLGALSRAVATLIIFPCIRAKTLVMSSQGSNSSNTTPSRIKTKTTTTTASLIGQNEKQVTDKMNNKYGQIQNNQSGVEVGVVNTLKILVKEEGFGALYKGMGTELVRGMLSSALMLMIKEKLYDANIKKK